MYISKKQIYMPGQALQGLNSIYDIVEGYIAGGFVGP
jgi:hypothetical protein